MNAAKQFVDDRGGDCPWGCGLPRRHAPAADCPPVWRNPKTAQLEWANGPKIALGTTSQLEDDLRKLDELRESCEGCTVCRNALRRRMNVIDGEINRRRPHAA